MTGDMAVRSMRASICRMMEDTAPRTISRVMGSGEVVEGGRVVAWVCCKGVLRMATGKGKSTRR